MIKIREYKKEDIHQILPMWNEVVEEGGSFPFMDYFSEEQLESLIDAETYAAVACENEKIYGFYILSPNIPGRCSSIANATYIVDKSERGKHIGEMLVKDSLKKAEELHFRMMQFNGVVDSNHAARHLYQKCGFKEIGVIPKGFQVKDGHYEDMHIMLYIFDPDITKTSQY